MKKATQQINAIIFQNDSNNSKQVSNVLNTALTQISAITQGTAVNQCTGTTVYAKSLYFQCMVMCNPLTYSDMPAAANAGFAANSYNNNVGTLVQVAKAKCVRVVIIQDRAPNGTIPTISDVYYTKHAGIAGSAPPNVKNYSDQAGVADSTTAVLALDPDKTRRFKILMNEVITVNLDNPVVHYEKYIPLNFFITYTGNALAVGSFPATGGTGAMIITNGIYVVAFCEKEGTVALADAGRSTPFYSYTAKLRFEP